MNDPHAWRRDSTCAPEVRKSDGEVLAQRLETAQSLGYNKAQRCGGTNHTQGEWRRACAVHMILEVSIWLRGPYHAGQCLLLFFQMSRRASARHWFPPDNRALVSRKRSKLGGLALLPVQHRLVRALFAPAHERHNVSLVCGEKLKLSLICGLVCVPESECSNGART